MKEFERLNCRADTKAYIVSIFSKFNTIEFDLSKNNLTIEYLQARYDQDFLKFQTIGDWLFFCRTLFPESLRSSSEDYFDNIAQLSYYSCYRLINKQWILYENLADEFQYLTESSREIILNI